MPFTSEVSNDNLMSFPGKAYRFTAFEICEIPELAGAYGIIRHSSNTGKPRFLSIETAGNLQKRVIETLNTRAFPDATHVLIDTESLTYPERVERAEQLRKEYSLETTARRVTGLGP